MLVTTLKHSAIDTKMSYSEVNWGNCQEMFSRPHHIVLAKEAAAQGILLFGCWFSRATLGLGLALTGGVLPRKQGLNLPPKILNEDMSLDFYEECLALCCVHTYTCVYACLTSVSEKKFTNAFFMWCLHNRRDRVSGKSNSDKAEKERDHLPAFFSEICSSKGGKVLPGSYFQNFWE